MPSRSEQSPKRSLNSVVVAAGRWLALLLLVASLAPVALPFMEADFPQGHDASAHLTQLFRFDRALEQGQLPVRWSEGIHDGTGQPLFNFYQVGFYYFVELLHQPGIDLSAAYKAAPPLLWWLGALFMLLLLRPLGLFPAVAGAIAFALSPYIIVDLFVRAAYPELAAITWAIGTLWATDAFLRSGREEYLPVAAVFGALTIVSHLPVTLMAAPAIAAHVTFLCAAVPGSRRRLPSLALAGAAAAGLAAFYVVPALVEMEHVNMRGLTRDGFDYHRHFVSSMQWTGFLWGYDWNYGGTSVTDPSNLMPVHVSLVQWSAIAGACALCCAQLLRRQRTDSRTWGLTAWLAVVALGLFMMHGASARVWETIGPLAFIQFPWRFFLLVSIGGGVLVAILVSWAPDRRVQAVLMLVVIAVHIHLYHRRLRPDRYLPIATFNIDDRAWGLSDEARQTAHDEPSYDPIGVVRDTTTAGRWSVAGGMTTIEPLGVSETQLILETGGWSWSVVRLHTPWFPGWRVEVDGADARIERAPKTGYMEIDVPPGRHVVNAHFVNTPVRAASNVVSTASGLLVAVMAMQAYRARVTRTNRRLSLRPLSASD